MTVFRFAILAPMLLVLAGCGEGWETRVYEGVPYGNRTAGSGVEYVRAVMKQEKGPVLRSEIEKAKEAAKPKEESEKAIKEAKKEKKIKDAAPIFDKKQLK